MAVHKVHFLSSVGFFGATSVLFGSILDILRPVLEIYGPILGLCLSVGSGSRNQLPLLGLCPALMLKCLHGLKY